jgi:hypothetical protein
VANPSDPEPLVLPGRAICSYDWYVFSAMNWNCLLPRLSVKGISSALAERAALQVNHRQVEKVELLECGRGDGEVLQSEPGRVEYCDLVTVEAA